MSTATVSEGAGAGVGDALGEGFAGVGVGGGFGARGLGLGGVGGFGGFAVGPALGAGATPALDPGPK